MIMKLLLTAILVAAIVFGGFVGSGLFESMRTGALSPLTSIVGMVACIAGAAFCVWFIWKTWKQSENVRQ